MLSQQQINDTEEKIILEKRVESSINELGFVIYIYFLIYFLSFVCSFIDRKKFRRKIY